MTCKDCLSTIRFANCEFVKRKFAICDVHLETAPRKTETEASRVEPGREEANRGGGEEGALEFFGGVFAGYRAGLGAARGTKGDHAGEGKPLPVARTFQETAAIAERGGWRRLDFRRLESAPDFFEPRGERGLHFPDGVGAPRKN
jgi:hypothetical protein